MRLMGAAKVVGSDANRHWLVCFALWILGGNGKHTVFSLKVEGVSHEFSRFQPVPRRPVFFFSGIWMWTWWLPSLYLRMYDAFEKEGNEGSGDLPTSKIRINSIASFIARRTLRDAPSSNI